MPPNPLRPLVPHERKAPAVSPEVDHEVLRLHQQAVQRYLGLVSTTNNSSSSDKIDQQQYQQQRLQQHLQQARWLPAAVDGRTGKQRPFQRVQHGKTLNDLKEMKYNKSRNRSTSRHQRDTAAAAAAARE